MVDQVAGTELLARFLTESGHFSPTNSRVKYKAFEPSFDPQRQRFETSVFRAPGGGTPPRDDLWSMALHVEQTRQKPALACATISASTVLALNLAAEIDEPPTKHAVIVRWPDGDEEVAKPRRKLIQQELAAAATLHLRA